MLAALDGDHPQHSQARAVLDEDPGPFLLSPLVLTEVDNLLSTGWAPAARSRSSARSPPARTGWNRWRSMTSGVATTSWECYRQLNVGLADPSLVVIAAREGTTRLLTFDDRHFRAIRPLRGRSFKPLPADA
jgi:predicted nucleic acid-binding protein